MEGVRFCSDTATTLSLARVTAGSETTGLRQQSHTDWSAARTTIELQATELQLFPALRVQFDLAIENIFIQVTPTRRHNALGRKILFGATGSFWRLHSLLRLLMHQLAL